MEQTTKRLTFRLETEKMNALQKLAAKEGISASQLVRRYIEKGMEFDGYESQIDFIRQQIREEIASQLKPRLERVVQIGYKGSLYSIETAFLCAEALKALVPPSKQRDFDESMERAIKAAVRVMDNQGIRRDRGFLEDLWTEGGE